MFILLLLSKNKSEIWFQYLVNYIIHTYNTHDNKYTAIYLIFMISFFILKEILFLLEIIEENKTCKSEIHRYLSTKSCILVNIACKFIMVTLLIVTWVASQYYFCQKSWLFLYVSFFQSLVCFNLFY